MLGVKGGPRDHSSAPACAPPEGEAPRAVGLEGTDNPTYGACTEGRAWGWRHSETSLACQVGEGSGKTLGGGGCMGICRVRKGSRAEGELPILRVRGRGISGEALLGWGRGSLVKKDLRRPCQVQVLVC